MRKEKKYSIWTKMIAVMLTVISVFSLFSVIPVSALNFNGESLMNGGGHYAPTNTSGYSVPSDENARIKGYRFAIVKENGDVFENERIGVKTVDVYRKLSGEADGRTRYKVKNKMCKAEIVELYNNNDIGEIEFTRKTSGTYYAITSGTAGSGEIKFYSALPTPNNGDLAGPVNAWQMENRNLLPIIEKIMGPEKKLSDLPIGSVITIEPIYGLKLEGKQCSMTATEIALYGAAVFGKDNDGGKSSTSGQWGFIADYTNRVYPNGLYTADSARLNGMWRVVTNVKNTRYDQYTFDTIIRYGYGVGIAYANMPTIKIVYRSKDAGSAISSAKSGTYELKSWNGNSNCVKKKSNNTVYTTVFNPGDKKTLVNPNSFGLTRTGYTLVTSSYKFYGKKVNVATEHTYNYYLKIANENNIDINENGNIVLIADARWTPSVLYSVSVDPNGGSWTYGGKTYKSEHELGEVSFNVSKSGVTNVALGTPTRIGYIHDEWNCMRIDANGTETWYGTKSGVDGKSWYLKSDVSNFQNFTNSVGSSGKITNEWIKRSSGGTLSKSADYVQTATWTPITYKVRFHGNGFTSGTMSDQTHTYDSSKKLTKNAFNRELTVTYKYNYSGSPKDLVVSAPSEFDGWAKTATGNVAYANTQKVKNLENTQNAVHNVYAKWDDSSVTLPTPTRVGYIFEGWYTAASGGTKIGDGGAEFTPANRIANPDSADTRLTTTNVTLYAHWTPIKYKVKFNGNGHTSGSMSNQNFTYDSAQSLTANAFKREFTVVYDYNGNGNPNSSEIAAATFNGWADRGSIVYNGATYDYLYFDSPYYSNTYSDLFNAFGYNKYNLINHYFEHGSGEGRSKIGSVPGLYPNQATVNNLTTTQGYVVPLYANWTDASVILPSPTRAGYTFIGWYTERTDGTKIGDGGDRYTPKANITIYAHWVPNSVVINVLKDGNAMDNSFKANVKLYQNGILKYSLTEHTSDTYIASAIPAGTYDIWADNYNHKSVDTGVNIVVTNASEKATINYYTLTLNKGEGIEKVNGNNGIYLSGETAIVNAPTVINGYHFVNWTGTREVNTTMFITTMTSKQIYTANAEANVYTITYKWSDDTVIATDTYTYGVGKSELLSQNDIEGYIITPTDSKTWSTTPDCNDTVTAIGATETGDKVFYKKKEANVYTITYKWSDGTVITTDTYTYGVGKSELLSQNDIEGYTITPADNKTWSTTPDCNDTVTAIGITETGDKVFYKMKEAKEADIYTITYKWSDGTVIDTDSYKQGEGKTTLKSQTAPTGYSVIPSANTTWSTNSDCTDSVTAISSSETGDKVFYKKKTANVYTITYKWSDDTVIATDTYTYGVGKSSLRSQVAPDGYLVTPSANTTWSTTTDCTDKKTSIGSTEKGNITLYKKKTSVSVTINVLKDAENWINSGTDIILYRNGMAKYSLSPVTGTNRYTANTVIIGTYDIYATGYNGKTIDTGIDLVVANTSNTATVNYYTLTLNKGEGIEKVNGNSGVYLNGETATIKSPTVITDYTFVEWYGTETKTTPSFTTVMNKTKEYTAKAKLSQFSITYHIIDKNGNINDIASDTYVSGVEKQLIDVPDEAINTGYKIKATGWYENSDCTGNTVSKITSTDTGDKHFYIKEEPIVYKIVFHGNTETGGTMEPQYITYDNLPTILNNNKFVKEYNVKYNYVDSTGTVIKTETKSANATFEGWTVGVAKSPSTVKKTVDYINMDTINTNLSSTDNDVINLYAVWTLYTETLPDVTKSDVPDGYEPEGWDPSGDEIIDPLPPGTKIPVAEDIEFTEVITPIIYHIEYKVDNEIVDTVDYTIEDTIIIKELPEDDTKDFSPWTVTFAEGNWQYGYTFVPHENTGKGHYGNVIIETISTEKEDLDIYLSPIIPNALYRENTDVITSYYIVNDSTSDICNIDDDFVVSFKVYNGSSVNADESNLIYANTFTNIVCPSALTTATNNKNLIWFKWSVPEGIESNCVTIVAVLKNRVTGKEYPLKDMTTQAVYSDNTRIYNTQPYEIMTAENPENLLAIENGKVSYTKPPEGYTIPNSPKSSKDMMEWMVWEYNTTDGWIQKNYSAGISSKTPVVSCTAQTAEYKNGYWYTKGGYGLTISLTNTNTANNASEKPLDSMYTSSQYAYAVFPEFYYAAIDGSASTLELIDGKWVFRVNEGSASKARAHYIPTWFTSGTENLEGVNYIISVTQSDMWTPMGMCQKTSNGNTIKVADICFNDIY